LKSESHPSCNFDARPEGVLVDTIVVHATVLDTLDEVIERFADPQCKVSAHYTIDRDGTIAAHVDEQQRAWHAGISMMRDGRCGVNDFSVGIELVNLNDGEDPYPASQLQALSELIREIASRHPIRYVIGHYECADPPGRKSDPRGLNMDWVRSLLTG
jgi:N-acetyl-anhydromuramyl-L-alanine amidase AmpD